MARQVHGVCSHLCRVAMLRIGHLPGRVLRSSLCLPRSHPAILVFLTISSFMPGVNTGVSTVQPMNCVKATAFFTSGSYTTPLVSNVITLFGASTRFLSSSGTHDLRNDVACSFLSSYERTSSCPTANRFHAQGQRCFAWSCNSHVHGICQ